VRSPRTDPGHLFELGANILVGQRRQGLEIEGVLDERVGELPAVAALLAAKSDRPEGRVVEGQKGLRLEGGDGVRELVECRLGRRQRDLLLEDDVNQGRESGLTVPQRRGAEPRQNLPEVVIDLGQKIECLIKRPAGELRISEKPGANERASCNTPRLTPDLSETPKTRERL
jgi:hypothetical protein